MSTETIADIVAFWLGPSLDGPEAASARRDWWYNGGASVDDRIAHFLALERELIESPDDALRFHSGPPGGARPTRRNSKQAGA